ncbi:MAG: dipeptide epimerase [Balneolales bacterium]
MSLIIRYFPVTLNLKRRFTISRWSRDTTENLFIEIEKDGIIGIGEAAPNKRFGETQQSASAFFDSLDSSSITNPYDVEACISYMASVNPGEFAAKAAFEMALHDWVGKKLGVATHALLQAPSPIGPKTSYTIGIDHPETIPEKVLEAEAYPILKVKLGSDHDREIIKQVRSVTNKPIWVDVNEGWKTFEHARDQVRFLIDHNVELIEQPMPAGVHDEMRKLKSFSSVPIVADESFTGKENLEELAKEYDAINIKLMKIGSISHSLRHLHQARKAGLKVMVGCMVESSLADTATAILSLWADYADLDGHLLITDDPCTGLKINERGEVVLNNKPGLGVEFVNSIVPK